MSVMDVKMVNEILTAHGGKFPKKYLLALATSESSLDPNAKSPVEGSTSIGLFGITKPALDTFNENNLIPNPNAVLPNQADASADAVAKPSQYLRYEHVQLYDPIVSTIVAVWFLTWIEAKILSAPKDAKTLVAPDWTKWQWPGLVTLGFKAGYSKVAGVAFVVHKMEQQGIPADKITVDSVAEASIALKATKWLSNASILKAVRSVVVGAGYEVPKAPAYDRSLEEDISQKLDKVKKEISSTVKKHPYKAAGALILGLLGLLIFAGRK